ncbi:MAG: hypothetical protein K6A34_08175 [Methanobrevibacter sp.]|nr:hypothetical protein [Methanobrevibacter sp.]
MKDNNNLLSYNQWSCGEYDNVLSGVNNGSGQTTEISNSWSSIGENSFKISRVAETSSWSECRVQTNKNEITASCDILALSNCVISIVTDYSDGSQAYNSVNIYASNSVQNASVHFENNTNKTITRVSLRISGVISLVYIDNLNLY